MAKNAKDRVQKYEFGGMVGRADRYNRLTGAPRDVSPSIRQRNIQGLEGRRPLPIPIGGSSPSLAKQMLRPSLPIPIGGYKKGGKVTKKKRR